MCSCATAIYVVSTYANGTAILELVPTKSLVSPIKMDDNNSQQIFSAAVKKATEMFLRQTLQQNGFPEDSKKLFKGNDFDKYMLVFKQMFAIFKACCSITVPFIFPFKILILFTFSELPSIGSN
jgi:hypothetical protein